MSRFRLGLASGSCAPVLFVLGVVIGVLATLLVAEQRDDSRQLAAGASAPAEAAPVLSGNAAGGNAAAPTSAPSGVVGSSASGPAQTNTAPGGGSAGSPPRRGVEPKAPTRATRGVTPTSIKIGVAYPDLSVLRYLGPDFDNGNPEEQWRAVLARWKREKLVPVNGRDVELVFRSYDVIDPAQQRAACTGLINDEKVFMVVGMVFFDEGRECPPSFKTPLITSDGPSDDVIGRTHPYLFSLSATESRHLRNFVYWAHDKGFLKGKKIGLYYSSRTIYKSVIQKSVAGTLKRLGYSITTTVETANERGGPEDVVAVQRFQRAGVNLAMLFHSKMGFMQQAEAQRYKPQYIDSDYFFGTSDAATSTYPADQFDRTFAITGRRVGEIPAGAKMDAEQNACFNNFRRYTRKNPPADKTEWSYVMYSCDEAKVLYWGLKNAGRNLNVLSFIRALETIRSMPLNRYMPISYSATKHDGGDYQRTLQWFGRENECHCWKAVGPIRPYYVS